MEAKMIVAKELGNRIEGCIKEGVKVEKLEKARDKTGIPWEIESSIWPSERKRGG